MAEHLILVRRLIGALMASLLTVNCGCMCFMHPVDRRTVEAAGFCRDLPDSSRSHVHIFVIHGLDPFDLANLHGVCQYLHDLGFNKVYYGQLYHTLSIEKEIKKIHEKEPEARFVVIGFSIGASMARAVALEAKAQGISIDLVMYLSGTTLFESDRNRPDNVQRVVNILPGVQWNADSFPEEIATTRVSGIWHFAAPTHARTLELLAHEIAAVAGSVPVPEPQSTHAMSAFDAEPAPRKVQVRATTGRDDWDFLKPVAKLKPDPQTEKPTSLPTGKGPAVAASLQSPQGRLQ